MENRTVRREIYDKMLRERDRWRRRAQEWADKCHAIEEQMRLVQDRCDALQFMLSNREDVDDDGD